MYKWKVNVHLFICLLLCLGTETTDVVPDVCGVPGESLLRGLKVTVHLRNFLLYQLTKIQSIRSNTRQILYVKNLVFKCTLNSSDRVLVRM